MEHVLRQCLIALRLGERLGFDESQRAVLYYVALLAWVGCHADAYEQARWFGDDIQFKRDTYAVDLGGGPAAAFMLRHLGAGEPPLRRARVAADFVLSGREAATAMEANHCLIAGALAERLGLGSEVRDALLQAFRTSGRVREWPRPRRVITVRRAHLLRGLEIVR